jgi:hypothetical protein
VNVHAIRTGEPVTKTREETAAEREQRQAAQQWAGYVEGRIDARIKDALKLLLGEVTEDDPTGWDGPGAVQKFARAVLRLAQENADEKVEALEAKVVALEKRLAAVTAAGELPQVKLWAPQMVAYKGALFTHAGCLWQSRRDNATEPGPSSDWLQVSRPGRDGVDGKSLRLRGLYHSGRSYSQWDVVLWGGSPMVAKTDDPGTPPGDNWMVLAPRGAKGARGAAGPRGPRGSKGDEGDVTIARWKVDPAYYRVTPILSNGRVGRPLELRSLFEQFMQEPAD